MAECLPLAQSENCSSMSSFEYRDRHLSPSTRETLKISKSEILVINRFELSVINEKITPLLLEGCLLCAYCQSFPSLGETFH